jgi:iron(III) transport system ATP-binding protein
MNSEPALTTTDLGFSYGTQPVLRETNLVVDAGSITALLGPSGGGKTTLLRLISGFERPARGEIRINGSLVASADGPNVAPHRRGVALVPQEGALFPHLDVAGNVAFGLAKRRGAKTRERVRELLDLVGLAGTEHLRPDQLSGGMQQRVAIARALAPDPTLILLDEPFSALDVSLRDQVREEVVRTLRRADATVLWVTHDQQEALSTADHIAVMLEGTIGQIADPVTLYQQPASQAIAEFIGEAVVLPGIVTDRGTEAECVLGRIALSTEARPGPAAVVLRPEDLALVPSASGDASGQVTATRYFGHDGVATVRLSSGELVVVRTEADTLPAIGAAIGVRSLGPAHAFPEPMTSHP